MLKAGFSIVDQGFVSISNFGLSVALARILAANEYGAFALDFNIFLVIAGFHNAIIIEPMSVFGVARHGAVLNRYLAQTVWLHVAITSGFALCGLVASAFLWGGPMGWPTAAMSVSCVPALLFWMVRRANYIETRPAMAAMASVVYFITLMTCGGVLWRMHWLSASNGFWAMGIASLVASVFSLRRLGVRVWAEFWEWRETKALLRENWNFGRWIVPSALLYPLLSQIQIFLLGAFIGLGAVGVLRALQNPILPVIQVVTALSTLAVPVLAREFSEGRVSGMYRRGFAYTGVMIGVAMVYELGVLFTGNLWDKLLYKERYGEYDWLMPLFGLLAIATALSTGISAIFRGMQRPQLITVMHIAGGAFGAASAYILIRALAVPGAVYGMVAAQGVTALASVILLFAARAREPVPAVQKLAAAAE